jgi:hypothetical protein
VRTRSGRKSEILMEAVDEAETVYLVEHANGQKQFRQQHSVNDFSPILTVSIFFVSTFF